MRGHRWLLVQWPATGMYNRYPVRVLLHNQSD